MVNFNENVYLRRGEEDRGHIPAMPFWFVIIRIVQFLLAFLVMALCAFAASVFGAGFFEGYSMAFFTFAWTLIFFGYIFATPLFAPKAYIYWAHLALEGLSFIFWLTTFALLVEDSIAWNALDDFGGFDFDTDSVVGDIWPKGESAIKASKAAAGLAALNWLLFGVSLGLFAFSVYKFRLANRGTGFAGSSAHAHPGGDLEAAEKGAGQPVELNHVSEHQVPAPYPA